MARFQLLLTAVLIESIIYWLIKLSSAGSVIIINQHFETVASFCHLGRDSVWNNDSTHNTPDRLTEGALLRLMDN